MREKLIEEKARSLAVKVVALKSAVKMRDDRIDRLVAENEHLKKRRSPWMSFWGLLG